MTDLHKLGYRARILATIVVLAGLLSAGFAASGNASIPLAYLALCGMGCLLLGLLSRNTQRENQNYVRRKLDMIRTDQKSRRQQIAALHDSMTAQGRERIAESHRLLGRIDYVHRQVNLQTVKYVALREAVTAWGRTALAQGDPNFEDAAADAESSTSPGVTVLSSKAAFDPDQDFQNSHSGSSNISTVRVNGGNLTVEEEVQVSRHEQ